MHGSSLPGWLYTDPGFFELEREKIFRQTWHIMGHISDAPNPAHSDNHDAEPNTLITPVDLGLPGSLPVVNATAVEYAISLGLALGCEIATSSRLARKNYFYPDLAKNYQISQYDEPIAFEGSVTVELEDGTEVAIPIERAHMEEDAGKLTHLGGATGRIQGRRP